MSAPITIERQRLWDLHSGATTNGVRRYLEKQIDDLEKRKDQELMTGTKHMEKDAA